MHLLYNVRFYFLYDIFFCLISFTYVFLLTCSHVPTHPPPPIFTHVFFHWLRSTGLPVISQWLDIRIWTKSSGSDKQLLSRTPQLSLTYWQFTQQLDQSEPVVRFFVKVFFFFVFFWVFSPQKSRRDRMYLFCLGHEIERKVISELCSGQSKKADVGPDRQGCEQVKCLPCDYCSWAVAFLFCLPS